MLFLASPLAAFITAEVLNVNGGSVCAGREVTAPVAGGLARVIVGAKRRFSYA